MPIIATNTPSDSFLKGGSSSNSTLPEGGSVWLPGFVVEIRSDGNGGGRGKGDVALADNQVEDPQVVTVIVVTIWGSGSDVELLQTNRKARKTNII